MAFSLKFEGVKGGGGGKGVAASAQTKDIATVAITIVLIVAVLFFFMKRQTDQNQEVPAGLVTYSEDGTPIEAGVQDVGAGLDKLDELIALLEGLEDIQLNRDVLEVQGYEELEDIEQVIPPPSRVGRPNPFIPIGFDPVSGVSVPGISEGGGETGVSDGVDDGFFSGDSGAGIDPIVPEVGV